MRQYKGYSAKKASGAREILPAGGYVAQIKAAKVVQYSWGERLEVAFDIIEGEFTGFFDRDYKNNTRDNKKWRGVIRISIPTDDDDPEKDAWKRNVFENFTYCLECSNSGYTWDWDENKLKGKKIGVLFNNFEWEIDGKSGWSTECRRTATVEDIRDGNFKIPADRPLKNKKQTTNSINADDFSPADDGDDVPF